MSGVVVIDGNAGSLTGAAMRGGDVVVHGRVGARTGIDQKGGTIIVARRRRLDDRLHDAARPPDHPAATSAPASATRCTTGRSTSAARSSRSASTACPGEWTDADTEFIERKFRIYGLGAPPELQKFVCGKQLYNYDTLEPSERKLVL